MNSIEFETELARRRFRLFRHPEVDILKQGFRPIGGSCGDMGVARHEGRYHFFYIERRLKDGTPFYPGHEVFFGHASTANFFDWTVHDPVLYVRPGTWEHLHTWAPVVIPYRGRYLMAYTGIDAHMVQNIGLAWSDDLMEWERDAHNPISPCAGCDWAFWRTDDIVSCRDPHLLEHDDRLYMTYTCNTAEGASCVGMCSTADCVEWLDHGPILVGPVDGFELEAPGKPRPMQQMESSNLSLRNGLWRLCVQTLLPGSPVKNYIFESERMDRFELSSGREFWPEAYTVEMLCDRGSRTLLACTGWIRFGEVDWADEPPMGRFLTTREELEAWQDV